jgi:cob(I)alamin adenosyltransferase
VAISPESSVKIWGFFMTEPLRQGLLQVYTGDGKGKTTAAVGLAVRALGQGLRVLLVQFLKPAEPPSGELLFLRDVPGIEVISAGIGVIDGRAAPEAVTASVGQTFVHACQRLQEPWWDMVIFDEINNALHRGHLPLVEFLAFLDRRPANLEVICTGRHAPPELLERADLVTRMEKVKHPLAAGIPARRGVEF